MSTRALRLPVLIWLLSTALGVTLAMLPLVGVHGVESALIVGLILPTPVAAVAARIPSALRKDGFPVTPVRVMRGAFRLALTAWAIPVLLLAVNSLRVPQCEPMAGLAFMALGPAIGVSLAAIVGIFWGTIFTPAIAMTLAAGTPVVSLLVGLHRLWTSPAVFAFDHFAGYFPGTIYDDRIALEFRYVSFRLVTLAFALSLSCVITTGLNPITGRLQVSQLFRRWSGSLCALTLLALGAAAVWHGAELGHRSTLAHIQAQLGDVHRSRRCTLVIPRELAQRDKLRLARDCDFRVTQAERALGVRNAPAVRAYFFRSAEEKRQLMGAARTYIAKPWRREVYLQVKPWPHPVLSHEVAHVVAAELAEGPFKVSGKLGGWIPLPGWIEGTAVAVAWANDDDLTAHQWARGMLELDRLPRLEGLLGVSFLGQPKVLAYTAAGSFVRFVLDTHGAAVVRNAYRHGITSAKRLAALELEWIEFLRRDVSLPEEAKALVMSQLAQKSVFQAPCPHRLAALRELLSQDIAAGDYEAAVDSCQAIVGIDPDDPGARAALVRAAAFAGRGALAREAAASLRAAPEPFQVAAQTALADAAWKDGHRSKALALYRSLSSRPQGRDALRLLEAKIAAVRAPNTESRLLFTLLIGTDGRGAGPSAATHIGQTLGALRSDGLGPYLSARQLVGEQRFDLARPLLEDALRRDLPGTQLSDEADRLAAIAMTDEGLLQQASERFRARAAANGASAADRTRALEWLERVRYLQSGL